MRTQTWFPGEFPRQCAGFSLLELVVVVILVSLVVAVVSPSFNSGLRSLELETAGRDLITAMKYARSEAIGKQHVQRIVLEGETDSQARYCLANEFGEVIKAYPLPAGVSFVMADEESRGLIVSFYPNGRSSGADFALKNRQGKEMPITVDPITGFARVVAKRADALGR